MMTISTNIARAQKREDVAGEATRAITQVQDVDQLERRLQKLELQERQRRSDEVREKRAQQFEGSWDVTVTPVVPPGVPQPPNIHAYATISRGAIISSDRTRPFSKQHGTCEYLGGDELICTSSEDLFDAAGTFIGTFKLRVRSTLIGADEFVGISNVEQRDAAGNLLFNRCATIRGQRIAIEALSPQCLNIVPPR
jgi:hypothetical protein